MTTTKRGSKMTKVTVERFIDEKEAWAKIGKCEELILKSLGRSCVLCQVETFENSYILRDNSGSALMTGLIYRDDMNYSVLVVNVFQEIIWALQEANNDN